jgi:putative ABC transport system permease protein
MNTFTAFRSAWRSLTSNLMRSILTMLGIIIGVAAVITTIAIGNGAQQSVAEQIKGLGTNLLMVVPGSVNASGQRLGAGSNQRLT